MNKKINARTILIERILELAVAVISIATLSLSYAKYTYIGKTYHLRGLKLLTGATICKGTVTVAPAAATWIFLIAMIVVILTVLLSFLKFKPILLAEIRTVAACVGIFASFKMLTGMANIINGAKSVSATKVVVVGVLVSVLLLILGLRELRDHKVLCALDFMVMPGMIYLLINNYIPMFGIYIAFKKVDYSVGLWRSDWIGLTNFKYLFATQDAFIITRNTLLYNAVFIVLGILTGMIAGICLAEVWQKFAQRFYQTFILLPQLISMVIVAYIVYGFFSNATGFVPNLLHTNINYYATPKVWPFILTFVFIWKQLGYNAIIFLSSIVGIDRSLYEAARVDGATKWQQITKITLPQLRPTVITLFMLQVGRVFYSDFGLFYQVPLDAGTLYNVTQTVDTYVFRALLVNNNISLASAASTYQSICGFILVFAVNMIMRKVDRENAMF